MQEPDWQKAFLGSNYGKLVSIKKKWDLGELFWAPTTPGSETWRVEVVDPEGIQTQNGRLCRV